MRNLITIIAIGMLCTAQGQQNLDLFKYIEYGTSVSDLEHEIGLGQKNNESLVYKIRTEIKNRKVRGTVEIKLDSLKTWYNSDYQGIGGLVAELTIPVKQDGDDDYEKDENYDRSWDWNWDLKNIIKGNLGYGFTQIDSSEGAQSEHFYIYKKDNLRIRIDVSVGDGKYNGVTREWEYTDTVMNVKVTYTYEK